MKNFLNFVHRQTIPRQFSNDNRNHFDKLSIFWNYKTGYIFTIFIGKSKISVRKTFKVTTYPHLSSTNSHHALVFHEVRKLKFLLNSQQHSMLWQYKSGFSVRFSGVFLRRIINKNPAYFYLIDSKVYFFCEQTTHCRQH